MGTLKELKEAYLPLQKKYSLPSFDDLNRDFRIERLSEIETDFLLREIRIFIADYIDSFIRFIEALLNPVNVPMFLFPILKSLTTEDKTKLKDIHKRLSDLEIDLMKLLNYSEENESSFLRKTFDLWQEIKPEFVDLISIVEKKIDIKPDKGNSAYLG